jgi:hypothetical protein
MSVSVLKFPEPKPQPILERPLYLDPECPFHYAETPFVEGQRSTAAVLQPAQSFAAGITRRLYAKVEDPQKGILICEDVLRGYLAAGYNAGYAAAIDQEFADVLDESDPDWRQR